MNLRNIHRVSSIKDTEREVYNFMSEEDYTMFDDNDVNLIAQEVDKDTRETFLDEKIYDAIQMKKDNLMETL